MRSILAQFMANRYAAIKAENTGHGRRYRQLRVLQEFWASNPAEPTPAESPTTSETDLPFSQDDDPLDIILSDVVGGIVIRTDFSDEEAWQAFSAKLKEAEEEISGDGEQNAGQGPSAGESSSPEGDADVEMADGNESDDSEDETEGKLIKILNPTEPEERAKIQNISNIRALRLLNDVDIRPAPPVPSGSKRVSPPNRLIDFAGWQEIYSGATLWIYDARSNTDRSARLISAEGDVYGTATGDSWRAQVARIPDLQLSITFENMQINFGGMDRWDYTERRRNLEEADIP